MVVFQGVCIALTNASINENPSVFTAVHVFKPSHNKEPLQLQYNCNKVTEMSLVLLCFVVDNQPRCTPCYLWRHKGGGGVECSAIITIHILLLTVNITLK